MSSQISFEAFSLSSFSRLSKLNNNIVRPIATKKGVNVFERGSQVHFMAEFQAPLDFPPAPKLDLFGKLDHAKATKAEMCGQDVFFGKGTCTTCHTPSYYTNNLMHNLMAERFYKPQIINGR